MEVLVACETSGVVREAFRSRGHVAISCDLLPSDKHSVNHIQGDCIGVIKAKPWDLIIMHPPCTAICVSGNRWYGKGMPKHDERIKAIEWTMKLWDLATSVCDRVAMENPVGTLPMKPAQYIQPWEFGHGETKKTGLWLHGLEKLVPTQVVEGRDQRIWKLPPTPDRWKIRSKTFEGIANAMASQWG